MTTSTRAEGVPDTADEVDAAIGRLSALAMASNDDTTRRRLEATRDRLAAYALAARGLHDAGVDEARRRALLNRGWREARAALPHLFDR